ncbi:Uncharacterised protein [Mycobacterium tuberculosis]|uniref:Uncharacterized protein n=1 Tax=Mycobacterium tuberculosis TaxID=1773 RepID=A0A916PA62_MYCTX|nr:Uncharacterised protein [Mycobacterium tuberculosis]
MSGRLSSITTEMPNRSRISSASWMSNPPVRIPLSVNIRSAAMSRSWM